MGNTRRPQTQARDWDLRRQVEHPAEIRPRAHYERRDNAPLRTEDPLVGFIDADSEGRSLVAQQPGPIKKHWPEVPLMLPSPPSASGAQARHTLAWQRAGTNSTNKST